MRIRIIPTKSLGCWAVPRTPASPTIPTAKPAASPARPTERPAPRWMNALFFFFFLNLLFLFFSSLFVYLCVSFSFYYENFHLLIFLFFIFNNFCYCDNQFNGPLTHSSRKFSLYWEIPLKIKRYTR